MDSNVPVDMLSEAQQSGALLGWTCQGLMGVLTSLMLPRCFWFKTAPKLDGTTVSTPVSCVSLPVLAPTTLAERVLSFKKVLITELQY